VSVADVSGNVTLPSADFAAALRTRVGQPFSRAALEADVAGLEDLYHRRGFAAARVDTAVEPEPAGTAAQVSVAARLQVSEGPRTLVGSVRVQGNASVQAGVLLRRRGAEAGPAILPHAGRGRPRRDPARVCQSGYANASVETNPA